MKKVISFLMTFLLIGSSLQAQDRDQTRLHEYLMLKDGNMYHIKDQDQIQLRDQVRLYNGTLVNPDGSYRSQDQKQLRLKDGQCLDFDGNRYTSQEAFRQHVQIGAQAMAQEHFMMQNGKMYRIQDQEKTQLQERAMLSNGATVDADGNVQLRDRKQFRLKDGECLDMEGKRYESQERFREKMEQRMQRMDREKMGRDNAGKRRRSN